jgi:hypothetical protein
MPNCAVIQGLSTGLKIIEAEQNILGKTKENFTRIGGLAALATLDFACSDVLEVTESVPGFHFGTGANFDAILRP